MRARLKAPARNLTQPLFVSAPLKQTARVMVKDEDVCVHCGLCAERCPTAAWDMQKSTITNPLRERRDHSMLHAADSQDRLNDFVIKLANVNGTGSASANTLLMKSIFRMGIPVMGKNYFPSNIQGLPTWYEIRVTRDGYVARSGRVDIMVAMNAETYAKDVKEVSAGGYLIYDSTWPRPALLKRDDITILGVPLARMCNETFQGVRARILLKNIMYAGVLAALLDIDLDVMRAHARRELREQEVAARLERAGARDRLQLREGALPVPAAAARARMDKTSNHIMIDGNTAAALGCLYAGATVGAWYPITPSTSLMDAFKSFCQKWRVDPRDRQAQLRDRAVPRTSWRRSAPSSARSWNGARAFTPTSGPGISLMNEFIGLAYYAEVPAVIFDIQRVGSVDRHADAHAAMRPDARCVRLARRYAARAAVPEQPRRMLLHGGRSHSISPSGCRRRCSSCRISTSA